MPERDAGVKAAPFTRLLAGWVGDGGETSRPARNLRKKRTGYSRPDFP